MGCSPVLSENSNALISRSFPMVVVRLAAQARAALHWGILMEWSEIRPDDLAVQSLMASFGVVMGNEFGHCLRKRQLTEKDLANQTRFFDLSHETFCKGIQVRGTHREPDGSHCSSLTTCCCRFIQPAKQTKWKVRGFMTRVSLGRLNVSVWGCTSVHATGGR